MNAFTRALVAIVVAGSVGLAAQTSAQTRAPSTGQKPPTPEAEKPAAGEQKVEGQIKSASIGRK